VGITERNKFFEIDYYHFRDYQRSGEIAIGRVDTSVNPADFFTKKLSPSKCEFYIDIISGSASTTHGFDNSLPGELHRCMLSPCKYRDHIPARVHSSTQDS